MTPLDIERAVWAKNPVAWFETHGRILSKKVGVDNANERVVANWLQVRVGKIVAWCLQHDAPIALILYKPRQKGCSTITVGISYVMGRLVQLNILVIGGQASQTDNLWKQLAYYAKHDRAEWGNTFEHTQIEARCSNGTVISRETAGDKEAGRSGTYHIVIATEVARWPTDGKNNAADVLNSVLNCVPANEPRTMKVFESTADGPVGIFPETWAGAVEFEDFIKGNRGNGYVRVFAPWHVFPDSWVPLTDEEKEGMEAKLLAAKDHKALRLRREMNLPWERIEYYHRLLNAPECNGDALKRDKEYPTTPEDGFAASGNSRFDLDGLARLEEYAASVREQVVPGVLEVPDMRFPDRVVFRPCSPAQATLLLFEKPVAGCAYVIATDNMTGASNVKGDDPDHNAVQAIRVGHFDRHGVWVPPTVVATLVVGNMWDMDVLAQFVFRLHVFYGRCMVVPERNRGEYLIAELRKCGVLLYEQERPASEVDYFDPSGDYGWLTTPETKKFLVEEIARAVRQPDKVGEGLRVPFPHIISQMRTFVTHPNGSEGAMKIAGCKDDFVIALGIGLASRSAATVYHPPAYLRMVPPDIAGLEDSGSRSGVW